MPFILKEYKATKGKKIQIALLQDVALKPSFSQRMLSRGRVFNSKQKAYKNNELVCENNIYIAVFEGHTRGLKPLITFKNFAIFDKPSNLVIHPNSKKTQYSLLDEIRHHLGEGANQAHRIDAETSGLVLVGKNTKYVNILADMFEEKKYKKAYLAIVEGEVKEEFVIDKAIDKERKNIGVRMAINENGKKSQTKVKPLKYNKKRDLTLLHLEPLTGRQHQIRIHLHSENYRILGDPIYGVSDEEAEAYLDKTLNQEDRYKATGSSRLWLQANYLEFKLEGVIYKIYSKNKDIYKEFERDL